MKELNLRVIEVSNPVSQDVLVLIHSVRRPISRTRYHDDLGFGIVWNVKKQIAEVDIFNPSTTMTPPADLISSVSEAG
jgi:hypothetical protein